MDNQPKKRGRKPKNHNEQIEKKQDVSNTEEFNQQPKIQIRVNSEDYLSAQDKSKKTKRGRKPKNVYNSYDNGVETTQPVGEESDTNIIVRLSVIDSQPLDTPKINDLPHAYNQDEYYNSVICNDNNLPIDSTISPRIKNNDFKVVNLLRDFKEKNKNKEWPSNTSIACYWCTEKFNNAPYGIPINYCNDSDNGECKGIFYVIGCFCSLECAVSFNFDDKNNNSAEMWERYNLINFLNRKMGGENIVKSAPDRLSLTKYGGHLSIEKFREFFKSNKIINKNEYPMQSVCQQIEEISEFEINNNQTYIPIDNERIQRYKDRIMMKHDKTNHFGENSLEQTMGLKYL